MTTTSNKFGVALPDGFNGSQVSTIEALFEITVHTIKEQKLFNGFTVELTRSPLGKWRYSLTAKESE